MNSLRSMLDGLFAFLARQGLAPPTKEVWLVEIPPIVDVDRHGRLRVRRAEFREVDGYVERYAELVAAGLPWINVSCSGVDRDRLVVLVEAPRATRLPSSRTSINYSGPTKTVVENGWDATKSLALF